MEDFIKLFAERNLYRNQNFDAVDEWLLQLGENENGYYFKIIDTKGKEVHPNPMLFTGAKRWVLKSLEQERQKNNLETSWLQQNDELYVKNLSSSFFDELAEIPLVNESLSPISLQAEPANLFLKIDLETENEKKIFQANFLIVQPDGELNTDFKCIHPEILLTENFLYKMEPIGDNFSLVNQSFPNLSENDFRLLLSLLISVFPFLKIQIENYKVIKGKGKISNKPTLIFKKVEEDQSLHLSFSRTIGDFDFQLTDQLPLEYYAEIDHEAHEIHLKTIINESGDLNEIELEKILKKCLPSKKSGLFEDLVEYSGNFILQQQTALNFIQNELPALFFKAEVIGAEKLKNYKVKYVTPKVNTNLSSGIDFLEGEVLLDFEGEKINFFDALQQFKAQKFIRLSNGVNALVHEKYFKTLERILSRKGSKTQMSVFDIPIFDALFKDADPSEAFTASREMYLGFRALKDKKVKKLPINGKLRPYQEYGFKWLQYLKENKVGGCLADDMGLGKTIQMISLLAADKSKSKKTSIIIMPRSLLFNWENELKKFAPDLTFSIYHGSDRNWEEALKHQIILTTYSVVRIDIEKMMEVDFQYICLDESQNIKNLMAKSTKAIMLLKGEYKFAISGTPVENNLTELYTLFRFLNPGMFGSLQQFKDRYLYPIQKEEDEEAMRNLRIKINPFLLRRTKKEVLPDLPDKIEQVLYAEMDADQQKLYEERRIFYKNLLDNQISEAGGIQNSQMYIFQALNELRQLASVPSMQTDGKVKGAKLEMLSEQLEEAVSNGHKVLVFFNFLAGIEMVSEQLEAAGISYLVMTGATRDRQRIVNLFQADQEIKVLLMTLKVGGVGLNLTAADTIFIFDPWWNKAAENQAIDRAHRIGQENKVIAYKLIMKNSIEEKMLQLQELKSRLASDILDSDSGRSKFISDEDLAILLS
jgi:superfamily II DNA or RNA helicase